MIITQTPLRISFAGGGTDFKDFYENDGHGAVVSATIDKYIYVIVNERFDDSIRVTYTKTEIVDKVDDIQHDLVREAMRLTGVESGVDVLTLADVPSEGSGLGSSSAVTVGLLNALHAYKARHVGPETLACEACRIEIDVLGRPIGKQDQYIAAYGGLKHMRFESGGEVVVNNIPLNPMGFHRLSESLALFYTGVTRNSSDILKEQKSNIADKMSVLSAMRDQADELAGLMNLVPLVPQAKRNMGYEVGAVGLDVREGWWRKKQLASGITNPRIDGLVHLAMSTGAIGAKVTGAGGGGFLLVCVRPHKHRVVREALRGLRELPINLALNGSRIILDWRTGHRAAQ